MEINIKISVNLDKLDTNKLTNFLKSIGFANATVEIPSAPAYPATPDVATPFDEPTGKVADLSARAKAQPRDGGRFKKKSNAGYPSREKLESLSTHELIQRFNIHKEKSRVSKKYRMVNTLRKILLERGELMEKKPPLRVVAKSLPIHAVRSK